MDSHCGFPAYLEAISTSGPDEPDVDDHDHEWAETDDCTTCGGGGRIYWNDSPINDPACTDDAECPDCSGDRERSVA